MLAPLLMAFQCDEELDSTLEFNSVSVKVTPKASFSLNDVIWLEGRVSSKVFDTAINDSIFNEDIQNSSIQIFKFITPNSVSNSKEAIDNFEIITNKGNYFLFEGCKNGEMLVTPELETNNLFYTYKIGLKPKFKGDFMITFRDDSL